MADEVVRALNEHERAIIGPEVAKLGELQSALARQRGVVQRMLALVEPTFGREDGRVRFDPEGMRFLRTVEEAPDGE